VLPGHTVCTGILQYCKVSWYLSWLWLNHISAKPSVCSRKNLHCSKCQSVGGSFAHLHICHTDTNKFSKLIEMSFICLLAFPERLAEWAHRPQAEFYVQGLQKDVVTLFKFHSRLRLLSNLHKREWIICHNKLLKAQAGNK